MAFLFFEGADGVRLGAYYRGGSPLLDCWLESGVRNCRQSSEYLNGPAVGRGSGLVPLIGRPGNPAFRERPYPLKQISIQIYSATHCAKKVQ